ncbi:unnamed protein product [Plutella xylostella]|uniref:(diamondback moth) hypothetical protein n=1 Tax=Plutella xylostella TaxID=51655 RepID=A0A8S4FVD5_PLUXY|nr:unnamed protein product [Plutella xylostella]
MADTELVTAIAFGLSYFYLKCKQSETKKKKNSTTTKMVDEKDSSKSYQFKAAYKTNLVQTELKKNFSGNCIPLENLNILNMSSIQKIYSSSDRFRMIEAQNEDEPIPEDVLLEFDEMQVSFRDEGLSATTYSYTDHFFTLAAGKLLRPTSSFTTATNEAECRQAEPVQPVEQTSEFQLQAGTTETRQSIQPDTTEILKPFFLIVISRL